MNRSLVDRIANAVLYEGYILYPYRPSIKNRQRWTFGGLYPEAYCRSHPDEKSTLRTDCLVRGTPTATFEAVVRFLHLTARQAGQFQPPLAEWRDDTEAPFCPVETLRAGGRLYLSWQEAEEREVTLDEVSLADLCHLPRT